MENLIPDRSTTLSEMKGNDFDIIIIGGGITGVGVARDATLRGLQVALLEKNDFGSGTSSMTSKMIHGGLRYLKNYEFRLVRQAALERKVHLEIAPHLAERMEFLVPLYSWSEAGKLKQRLGLFIYDLLAFPKGIGKRGYLDKEQLLKKLPLLENEDLVGGSLYWDLKTDDARLTLANALSSSAGGGNLLNYAEVKRWKFTENGVQVSVVDRETDEKFNINGKVLILCTGPWTDLTEKLGVNFEGKSMLRLTRGIHLRLKKRLDKHPCLIVNKDGRPIFLIPRLDYDLAGTTDIDYQGNPDDIAPTIDEVNYLISACNLLFPTAKYSLNDVVSSFAGVRPLVFQKGADEQKTSREHSIFVDKRGVITLVGGKLTTYRVMAKDAIKKALKLLKYPKKNYKCITDKMPLWGGDIDNWDEFFTNETERLLEKYDISISSAEMLVKWYGSELALFEEILVDHGNDVLKEGRPWLKAQVVYSCRVEFARTPIDFLRRRTPIMLEEKNGLDILHKIINIMGKELKWTEVNRTKMQSDYKEYVRKFVAITLE